MPQSESQSQNQSQNKTKTTHTLPNLASMIFNTPLLITSNKLDEILGVLGDRIFLTDHQEIVKSLSSYTRSPSSKDSPLYQKIGRTAVISLTGTLLYKGGWMSALSGVYSYTTLRKVMGQAMDDASVDSILLDIDSHGGTSAGLFDTVDYLTSLRSRKPIIGVSNESAFSAAYAILSSAHEVFVSRTASVGSIGAVAIFRDISKALEKSGVKITAIYAGKHKVDYASFKPISEEAFNQVQADVNKIYDMFVSLVAKNNNRPEQEIRDTEAAIFSGQEAVDRNLADAVMPYNNVVEYIAQKFNRKGGLFTMPRNVNLDGQDVVTYTEEEVAAKIVEANQASKADFDKELSEKLTEAKNASALDAETKLQEQVKSAVDSALEGDRSRVVTILGACKNAGLDNLAQDHIEKGTSVADVNALLLEALAAKSEAQTVVTANNPSRGELSTNPLIVDAKQRAADASK